MSPQLSEEFVNFSAVQVFLFKWRSYTCLAAVDECGAAVLNDCAERNANCVEDPAGGYTCECADGFRPDPGTGVCQGARPNARSPCGVFFDKNENKYKDRILLSSVVIRQHKVSVFCVLLQTWTSAR